VSDAPDPTLLYRRQFLLGPRPIAGLPAWKRHEVGPLHLAAHPDLPVRHAALGETSLTLLGFALDPERPGADDHTVLDGWLARMAEGEDLFEILRGAAGRYALVVRRPGATWLLHDAAGFRTVVHTGPEPHGVWCASDAPLLAAQLGLAEDPWRRRLWVDATGRRIVWLPLRETLHRGVHALLPNHALDLATGRARRFWPVEPLGRGDFHAVADAAAEHLRRIADAGARRFPLALGITAGIDSRMLLAALREHARELFLFTFDRHPERTGRDDVRIPARMLARAGLAHHLLRCDAPGDPAVRVAFDASHTVPSTTRWEEAIELARSLPPGAVRVSGHVGEAGRATFSPRVDTSPRRLARRSHAGAVWAARRRIAPWWRDAREVARRTGYTVRDLHYLESRMGRWAAASQNQYDLAADTFSPFACRGLLERLLSIDERDRAPRQGGLLSLAMVERLWPELTEEAVNPKKARERLAGRGGPDLQRQLRIWRRSLRARLDR